MSFFDGTMTDQQHYERSVLDTKSHNNILMDYEDQAIKRYVKTGIGQLTLFRLDLLATAEKGAKVRTDVFLHTRRDDNAYYVADNGEYAYRDYAFHYNDNVIELYTPQDIDYFESRNKNAIESNAIIEYEEGIDYTYALVGYNTEDGNSRPIWRLRESVKPLDLEFSPATVKRGE